MSRIKKIVFNIIAVLISIFMISNVSNAEYDYELGDTVTLGNTVTITYDDYSASNNIFCVEHTQNILESNKYTIISNVKIDGTKSTDHEGNNSCDNRENAKLAYILNSRINNKKEDVQNAIWNYMYTWMELVGKNYIYKGFASSARGTGSSEDTQIENDADTYANNLRSEKIAPEDETDKSKISVQSYEKDNKQYIRVGPFKWNFGGRLTEIKAYNQDDSEIENILYSKFIGTTEKFIGASDITASEDFYISIPVDAGVSKITKIAAKESINEITADIWFLDAGNGSSVQNLIIVDTSSKEDIIDMSFDYDIALQGNLKVIKVNKDNETIKLPNVGFYIQNKDTGKYVKRNEDGTISYKDNKEDAEEFMTDTNGEIFIENLLVGTYIAYETKNPNYGYEIISEGQEKQVIVDKTAELKIPNKQIYLKLSGYVWVDKISGKRSERDDLYYNNGDYESDDTLLDGITVKLKNRETGETVKETKTANGGAYKFVDVLIADLDKYYIEFEYDGLTYTNVVAHTDKDNGSKASEGENVRTSFNSNFAVVEGKSSNTSITRDTQGNEKHTITYNIDNHTATVDKTKSYYEITANTDVTEYKIKDHFTYGQEEIKYINLGLYEREMPDIRLEKDVENVELSINGFNHVYEYGSKKLDNFEMEKDEHNFNVGVKFASTYTGTYKRAVYEPDYNYTLANQDKDNKLNVYLTYRIAMYNESTTLKTRINSIVDYFDKNFTIEKIGTGINKETGEITGNITVPQIEQSGDYNKVIIQNNTEIEAEKVSNIYVRFKLSDQEVLNAFNNRDGKMTYKNIAEVNSYSVFDKDGKVYAGIDKDSIPANSVPGDIKTYEDDTNQAPGIQLEVQGNRTLSGSVFFDESTGGVAQVRLGDGIYDTSKEHGIAGVKVTLTENKENGEVRTATTDDNGNFTITDFIPGNYKLTYTWGDKTYSVQDYKGTIWNNNNRTEKEQNGDKWYKVNVDNRYSDAMDNWETRQKIDSGENITTMDSTTPTMALDVEVNSVYSIVPDVDRFVAEGYEIRNIDFGIVERARQQLDIVKQVKTFKVTLANGQRIVDATVEYDDKGNSKLVGSTNNVIYMQPGTNPVNGQIWLQLDNELIQGAKVQVGYEIKVSNNSELDYDTDIYYYFGQVRNNDKPITIIPTGVYDYLDGMIMDPEEDNTGWEVISKEEYNNKYKDPTVVEKYFITSTNTIIDENGNALEAYTWEVSGRMYEIFYEEWMSATLEGRTVRDAKLNNKAILHNAELEKEIAPGKSNIVNLNTSTTIANSNEIDLNNNVEITEFKKNKEFGNRVTPRTSGFIYRGQTITITPPTGENNNYILIITAAVVALVILGVGVILIKKKTL